MIDYETEADPMTEDPLQFVSTLALYQFYRKHTKILRIIEYIFIMMMESTTLWVLFVIIVTKNISYIERFLLFQMIQQNACAIMYLHIKINTYMGQFLDCFQVSFVSLKKVSNIIKQDVIIIQTVCVLMFIIGLLVHLNCLLLNVFNAKESIYYPAAYLENKYVMILLLLPQWFMMTYEELYIVWAVFYFAIHLKFQLDALTRYLKEKIIDLQVDERICMEDKHYQDIVYRRLRFCAQRHVKLKQIFEETACKVASAALLLSIFTGSLCVIAALYFILNNVNPKFNSIMYGVLINATLYHYSGNYYGQKIIDASENFYIELTMCPYYYWNKRNRGILQMLLNGSKTPVAGVRFCYSVFALIKNF